MFITIMYFDAIKAVHEFEGEDYTKAVVPDKAEKVLSRVDERVKIYKLRSEVGYKWGVLWHYSYIIVSSRRFMINE